MIDHCHIVTGQTYSGLGVMSWTCDADLKLGCQMQGPLLILMKFLYKSAKGISKRHSKFHIDQSYES